MPNQIFSAFDLLAGNTHTDTISREERDILIKYLEEQYSHKIDAITKDFDDDKNEDNIHRRTYLERRSPLQFSMVAGSKQMGFFIRFNDAGTYHGYDDPEPTTFNEVEITFEDGVTTRSAYGTKVLDGNVRKRKIKYISKFETTLNEILDRMIQIAEVERKPFLVTKRSNEIWDAGENLRNLKDELQSVEKFQKLYNEYLVSDETQADFEKITNVLESKIDLEKTRLRDLDLLNEDDT